jgi:hypothetical protein
MLSLQVIGGNGGDQVRIATSQTPDGGVIVTMSTSSTSGLIVDNYCPSYIGAIFKKYNHDATITEWIKCRKNSWGDTGFIFMFETTSTQYILGGVANSGIKWVVRKEDVTGNVLWTKAYGGNSSQMLYSMTETGDGGYILFGSAYDGEGDVGFHYGSIGTRDFWVLKVDANGEKVWSKVYGGTGEDIGGKVLPAPGNGCYIVGSTNSTDYECTGNHGATEAFIARLDASGNIIWRKVLGGSGYDGGGENQGCTATPDGKGGVLIATISGSNDGDVNNQINYPGSNIWLINIDSTGTILWENCYGGGGSEYPNSVCYATDGSIWVMGCSQVSGGQVNAAYGSKDAYVVHTDNFGNFLNAKVLGSTRQDVGHMIYPLSNGLVIGGGYYSEGNGIFPPIHNLGPDAFLVKFTNWAADIYTFSTSNLLTVYPNPAKDIVTIDNYENTRKRIVINDITGRLIYSNVITSKMQISINEWQAGMYYVQLLSDDGQKIVQKLIIQ